ncbi:MULTISPECIES: MarR family winged helix-turn-helix transcriptional regulator [Deinococcus]|uniref:MarR family winged helix-turn-helix transcriptional regulator n=1 Tax=Deinococcus TaxID=1298 RepID=UPI00131A18F7|nr:MULTISPECIES: MarR family transcriptional regulator [Deinococcus]
MFSPKHKGEDERGQEHALALLAWSRLVRVAQKVSRLGAERLRERGLTPVQFDVLRRIASRPDQPQQDLVERLDVTRGNVSQLLSKLEADGLILRVPQGGANLLRLTDRGQEMVALLLPDHDRFIRERFAALSTEEVQHLLFLLEKLDRDVS